MPKVIELEQGLELWRVRPDDLREQEQNARVLPPVMFERLQKTIARDGRLESLPLIALTESDKLEIVSGHHRVRAAKAAELEDIFVLVDVTGLNRSQIIAKQLAHNSISGVDDQEILRRLYEQIDDVESRLEAFIDEASLNINELVPVSVPGFVLDTRYGLMQILFIEAELDEFQGGLNAIEDQLDPNSPLVLIDKKLEEQVRNFTQAFTHALDVKALGAAFMLMIEAAAEKYGLALNDLGPGNEWKTWPEAIGSAVMPPETFDVLKEAIAKMKKSKEVDTKEPWQAIELMARNYLEG